ncbi:hypothetical protein [Tumebacillus lipolyticus]|uniref:Uncharacterized protein n=1 Tax=Tumebacillus lipolyticus TaxID=1280370 RepID=A0ABW4ZTR2_9BACL
MTNDQEQKRGNDQGSTPEGPTIPNAMRGRVSMKWLTLAALAKLIKRFELEGSEPRVMLLTAGGQLEGTLCEIRPSYAESYRKQANGDLSPDVASMVTHMRSDLLALWEQEEQSLQLIDSAPILSLRDVVVYSYDREQQLSQLTLFADQVIGFSLTALPILSNEKSNR